MSINLEQAKAVISGALASGRSADMMPLCVVVLDDGGHVVSSEREDGASFGRFDVAHGKAFGAIGMGMNSRMLGTLAEQRAHFVAGVNGTFGGALVPAAGGVIIVDGDGAAIGAVGISGDNSDNDEIAAMAGIEAAGLRAKG